MRQFTTFDGLFDFTRTTPGYELGQDGQYHKVSTNEPRRFFNTDGTFRGLIKEAQQTNLVPWSCDFSKWRADAALTLTNKNSMVEGQKATKIENDLSDKRPNLEVSLPPYSDPKETLYYILESSGHDYCNVGVGGVEAKLFSINVNFSTESLSVVNGAIDKCWIEWAMPYGPNGGKILLVAVQDSIPSSFFGNVSITQVSPGPRGQGRSQKSSVIVHAAQKVAGAHEMAITSPIVTQGSQVTRAEDEIQTWNSDFINKREGTLFIDIEAPVAPRVTDYVSYGPYGYDNALIGAFGNGVYLTQLDKNGPALDVSLSNHSGKGVLTWDSNNRLALFHNGNKLGSNTYANGLSWASGSNNKIHLGKAAKRLFFRKVYFLDRAMSDQEAKEATA